MNTKMNTQMNVLFVAAMEEEERALLAEARGSSPIEDRVNPRLGISAHRFGSRGAEHWIARSGVGAVNAALTASAIAEARPVGAIVLLGVGGALVPELRIGELVVALHVLQHDSLASLDSGDVRMRPGDLILTRGMAASYSPLMATDPGIVEKLAASGPHVAGTVASGAEFVGTAERKRAIAALRSNVLLVEMEAGGIAQVASRLGLPFGVAKTVADRLSPEGGIENDFKRCLEAASRNAAAVLRSFL